MLIASWSITAVEAFRDLHSGFSWALTAVLSDHRVYQNPSPIIPTGLWISKVRKGILFYSSLYSWSLAQGLAQSRRPVIVDYVIHSINNAALSSFAVCLERETFTCESSREQKKLFAIRIKRTETYLLIQFTHLKFFAFHYFFLSLSTPKPNLSSFFMALKTNTLCSNFAQVLTLHKLFNLWKLQCPHLFSGDLWGSNKLRDLQVLSKVLHKC